MKVSPLRKKALKATLALASTLAVVMPVSAMAQEDLNTVLVRKTLVENHVSGVSLEALENKSIEQMIESLKDPYTVLFTPQDYGQFSNTLENSFEGIGCVIGLDDKGVYVSKPIPGSPAAIAGLQKDDYIRAVDGVPASTTSIDEVRNKIIGVAGTKVKVTVLRGDKVLTFEITRQAVNSPEVYSSSFTNGVGYIQITDFSDEADEEFDKELSALQEKGLKSLILDVRDNPGGYLETARNIAKHFVKDGVLIHTKDRDGVDDPVNITDGNPLGIPVYILANENSASASEVLSGALQDYGVAKVIGMQTYGKGSVQQLFEFPDHSVLKVTVEEYLTPKMRKVNKEGITPDLQVDGVSAQFITALHESGISDIQVMIKKHGATYNGVDVGFGFGSFQENGKFYASARGLAALIGAKISWNNADRTVDITDNKGTHAFPIEADKLMIVNDASYINVDLFDDYFPQLKVNVQGDSVSIQGTKGN
ncbi:carboxyl-terminal processing protease [Paenibacillus qinlingensis]|uniref:Carboxyl-terminal processing protease n=2 Tax=Paenibacillus qinlingensis TaxID=1837343 RepID=A0ABU1NRI8_9BACL|nr:carboxyl-terminal processing protease [Paenibacillus qinlingensis]